MAPAYISSMDVDFIHRKDCWNFLKIFIKNAICLIDKDGNSLFLSNICNTRVSYNSFSNSNKNMDYFSKSELKIEFDAWTRYFIAEASKT